jgi:acyl carrier protein
MEKIIIKILTHCFKIKKKELQILKKKNFKISNLKGFDSLNYLKFISQVEEKFKITVNRSNIEKFSNYNSLIAYLSFKSKKKN